MKKLLISVLALSLLGATAASAEVGAGVHIGGLHVGAGVGVNDHHTYHRHCSYSHHRRHCW